MSSKQNSLKISYNGFSGIDTRLCCTGRENLVDVENFRILAEGSLKKRSGYAPLYTAPENIRAIKSGYVCGEYFCFLLSGNSVYSLNVKDKTAVLLGTVASSTGRAEFFHYRDSFYLCDGEALYKVSAGGVSTVTGYIPLYGKDWGTTFAGEVNEAPNLLNGKVRITYKVPADYTALFPVGRPISSVVYARKNGSLLSDSAYSIDSLFNAVSIPGVVEGDEISLCVVLDMGNASACLLSSCSASVFGGIEQSRLFLWGGKEKNKMYICRAVSSAALASAESDVPACGDLYFPEGESFIVGDGQNSIRAVCRHYSRMLIFTESDVWMADSDVTGSEPFPVMNINSSGGCAQSKAITRIGNDPVSISKQGVLRWSADTDEFNECNSVSISDEIREKLPSDFAEDAIAFADIYRGELWFHSKLCGSNAWIYNIRKSAWVRFAGISADAFFDADGEVGFVDGKTVFAFDDTLFEDTHADGSTVQIRASFEAQNLDFESNAQKRLSEMVLCANSGEGNIEVLISTNAQELLTRSIATDGEHSIKRARFHSSRFSYIKRIFVYALGTSRPTLYRLELRAR